MPARIIRSAAYRHMPWRNGGGTTTEIAISPQGAATDDFNWRVSMASVTAPGWFSEFALVDRTLGILDGAGILLSLAADAPVEITQTSAPYRFPADVPTYARLIDGPVTDLNVMTRRGRFTHRLRRLRADIPLKWNLQADVTIFLSYTSPLRIDDASAQILVPPRDSAMFEDGSGSHGLTLSCPGEVYVIELCQLSEPP